jgi:DNA-binding Lrp family transcriptional regulator
MQEIDQRDRELLAALQSEVPLVSTPFAFIGQMIDMSEKEVIKRTERLKRDGVVRQISAIFEPRALGYRTCLVAAKIDAERADEAAAVIGAHPGVTQNFRRNHDFNIWFTLNISPISRLGLDRTIEILGEQSGAEAMRSLPTLKLYKAANQELAEHGAEAEHPHGDEPIATLDRVEIEAIRVLQNDLPLQPRPFDILSRTAATIGPDELLAAARAMLNRQQLRRFAATIQPRKSGFTATAMAVWRVPPNKVDEYGAKISAHRAVSHCYLRPVYEDWPYNLFTTVHGRSVDECESVIHDLASDTGLRDGRALYPIKEYKRERIHLFAPELDVWESAQAGGSAMESAVS